MRTTMKAAWLKAETVEMDGLINRHVWNRVLCSTLTAQDKVFSTRFHYKNAECLNGDSVASQMIIKSCESRAHRGAT